MQGQPEVSGAGQIVGHGRGRRGRQNRRRQHGAGGTFAAFVTTALLRRLGVMHTGMRCCVRRAMLGRHRSRGGGSSRVQAGEQVHGGQQGNGTATQKHGRSVLRPSQPNNPRR